MNLSDALTDLYHLPHRLQDKLLLHQISALHPELDAYQGEDKIKVYTLLANRLPTDAYDFQDGQKPVFNYDALKQDNQLKYRAMAYFADSQRLVYHFIAKLVTATSKLQPLTDQLKATEEQLREQLVLNKKLVSLLDQFTEAANKISQKDREFTEAIQLNSRLN